MNFISLNKTIFVLTALLFLCVKNDSQEYYGIGELKSTNRFSENFKEQEVVFNYKNGNISCIRTDKTRIKFRII